MNPRHLTFVLTHGRDTIPVPIDPLDSLVSRSLDALGASGLACLDRVTIAARDIEDVRARRLLDKPFADKSCQFHNTDFETFLGIPVQVHG
jgi:hypothetical protein